MQLYSFEGNMLRPLPPLALERLGYIPHPFLLCIVCGFLWVSSLYSLRVLNSYG